MLNEKKREIRDLFEWLRLNGHEYSILQAAGVMSGKQIAFSHKDCKYYVAPEVEIAAEKFKAELLPYLRWSFEKIVPEVKEVEVEEEYTTKAGNKSKRKVKKEERTGNFINEFPPTTENIIKKRNEIRSKLYDSDVAVSEEDIKAELLKTIPRLSDHERIEAIKQAKGSGEIDRLAHRLQSTI